MPASLYLEEAFEKYALLKVTPTAITKCYLGFSTEAPLKKWSGTEFEAKEPTSGNGWARIESSGAEKPGWEVATKAEGATGFTIFKNKNEIKTGAEAFEFKKLSGGEYKLEYWGFFDALTAGNMLLFGKLGTALTINAASELKAAPKELVLECE
jgi:hypothetical protein